VSGAAHALDATLAAVAVQRRGAVYAEPIGGAVLYEAAFDGTAHGHRLRIIRVDLRSDDGDTCDAVYVEVEEPGKCACVRRVPLSEVVHLLLNVEERELWTIPNRDRDFAGCPHVVEAA
jgi:hypothetical protein